MILATKAGWLIACTVTRRTKRATYVKAADATGTEVRVPKRSPQMRLFTSANEAINWIEGKK